MAEELIQPVGTQGGAPAPQPSVRGTSILEQIGVNTKDVLTGSNIQETIETPQAPVNDALGIFTAQEEAQGIPGLKTAFQTAQANRLKGEGLANQEQLTIQGRAKKLGVLRGEQGQAAAQANLDLQTLGQAESLAQSALSSAQATATQRANILYGEYKQKTDLQLQFPGLKIDPLSDDFGSITEKLAEYKKDEEKKAKKNSYKDALRALGKKTSGSRRELEKRLRKANKKSYEQAQRQNDIQMEQLEMSLSQARKKMNETNKSTDSYLDDWAPVGSDKKQETTSPLAGWR